MKHFLAAALTTSLATVALTACTGAEWNSINRQFSPGMGDSRLVDAKQRAIIAINKPVLDESGNPVTYTDGNGRRRLAGTPNVCAEPSPDALQATAAALGGSGSLDRGDIALALQGALSSAEGAASFGLRTQTIQLLRDAYYRLCEAYLNDGIDSISYDVLQRRFQNQIIALLAVEQLTGVVKGAQARVSTTAAADSGANIGAIAARVKGQGEAVAAAQATKDQADKTLADKTERSAKLGKEIEALEPQVNAIDPSKGTTPEEIKALTSQKDKLRAELQAKQADKAGIDASLPNLKNSATEAKNQLDAQNKTMEMLTKTFEDASKKTAAAFASGTATGSETTGGLQKLEPAVVYAVRAITLNAINQDYETQVCFEALRAKNHSGRYKNKQDLGGIGGGHSAFLLHCQRIFAARQNLAYARANAVERRNAAIDKLITAVSEGKSVKAQEAYNLILALDYTTPVDNTTHFLAQELNYGASDNKDGKKSGGGVEIFQILPPVR